MTNGKGVVKAQAFPQEQFMSFIAKTVRVMPEFPDKEART
jgi:hypothetical protein